MYYAIGSIVVKIQQRGIFHLVFNMEAILFVIKKKKTPQDYREHVPLHDPHHSQLQIRDEKGHILMGTILLKI